MAGCRNPHPVCLRSNCFELLRSAAQEMKRSSFLGQCQSDGSPDASASSRDEGCRALECAHLRPHLTKFLPIAFNHSHINPAPGARSASHAQLIELNWRMSIDLKKVL